MHLHTAENMFVKHRLDLNNTLRNGNNTIKIKFRSPVIHDSIHQSKNSFLYPDQRSFSRKAPYQYGWDWGPVLVDIGIWKPVYLEFYNHYKLENISVTTDSISAHESHQRLSLYFVDRPGKNLHIHAKTGDGITTLIDTTINTPKEIEKI